MTSPEAAVLCGWTGKLPAPRSTSLRNDVSDRTYSFCRSSVIANNWRRKRMKLNVHEWGTGDRTALLIHGLFADHQNWYRVGPALAERGYRVIAPDLRGHGASPRGAYSPALWAADLIERLPKNADLAIGHSLAGMALALAVKELTVRRAIYIDPTWLMSQ